MEVLTENYYDLILVDYNYGDISLDGLGVVKFIKEKNAIQISFYILPINLRL